MVAAPGGYARVPSEPFLVAVEGLPKNEILFFSEAGRVDANIQLSRMLWMDGDTIQPIELLQAPAQSGIPVAQYMLGTYLRFRNRDLVGSARYLLEAAWQGHAVSQETVAGFRERGVAGLEKDEKDAFRLYLAAGKQGLRHSQMNVGIFLCKGKGVAPDKTLGRALR